MSPFLAVRTRNQRQPCASAEQPSFQGAMRRKFDRHFWIRPQSDDPHGLLFGFLMLRGIRPERQALCQRRWLAQRDANPCHGRATFSPRFSAPSAPLHSRKSDETQTRRKNSRFNNSQVARLSTGCIARLTTSAARTIVLAVLAFLGLSSAHSGDGDGRLGRDAIGPIRRHRRVPACRLRPSRNRPGGGGEAEAP